MTISSKSDQDPVTASRGMPGVFEFEYQGPKLIAREPSSPRDPVMIRVAGPEHGTKYTVRFVVDKSGAFDLRDHLIAESGSLPADVPEMPIVVVSNLPRDYGTDLFENGVRNFSLEPYYFLALWVVGIIWASMPVIAAIRRLLHRVTPPVIETKVPVPTIAERIRDLVLIASDGKITTDQKASLELLLIAISREELKLEGLQQAQAMRIIREHPRAGELIRAVERWIHAPDQAPRESARDVQALILRSLPENSLGTAEEARR